MMGKEQNPMARVCSEEYKRPGSDPVLLLAQILESRGLGVRVGEEKKVYRYLSDHYYYCREIFATTEGKSALVKISQTSELTALIETVFLATEGKEPQLEDCPGWDDETKRKVKACYWQSLSFSAEHEGSLDFLPSDYRDRQKNLVREYQTKAQSILGELPPLTPEDIHFLIKRIVERELPQDLLVA